MAGYEYITDEDGEIKQCDCCGYPAPLTEFRTSTVSHKRGSTFLRCEICDSTAIGIAFEFPHQYEGQAETLRVIGYVANRILDEIRKLK